MGLVGLWDVVAFDEVVGLTRLANPQAINLLIRNSRIATWLARCFLYPPRKGRKKFRTAVHSPSPVFT